MKKTPTPLPDTKMCWEPSIRPLWRKRTLLFWTSASEQARLQRSCTKTAARSTARISRPGWLSWLPKRCRVLIYSKVISRRDWWSRFRRRTMISSLRPTLFTIWPMNRKFPSWGCCVIIWIPVDRFWSVMLLLKPEASWNSAGRTQGTHGMTMKSISSWMNCGKLSPNSLLRVYHIVPVSCRWHYELILMRLWIWIRNY